MTVLAMIRVGEKLLQRYGARLPMMAGPVLTAIAIALISCTFLEKALYIGVVFASNVLFGLGLGCYATPSTDTAVANAPEKQNRRRLGDLLRWAARWAGRWVSP
ncbi:transporter [Klebsiella pneumoniae]|nr:transporter [Klebsiella pneumoniae]